MSKLVFVLFLALLATQTIFCKAVSKKHHQKKLNLEDSLDEVYAQPEQIHLSYGSRPDQMIVTWVTQDYIKDSYVEYGINSFKLTAQGTARLFTNGGDEKRNITIHRVVLSNLTSGETYLYHCGSPSYGWSPQFFFVVRPNTTNWSPRFAVFGDMGNVNAQSLPQLQKETLLGYYDAILHVGDFAYNMDDDNGRVGDAFMNQIEPIAAYLPYMTCVGNHENAFNFSNYVNLFSMPRINKSDVGGDNNFFYSVNIGPIHLIGISTEFYYYINYGIEQIIRQYKWLENDLKIANLPENRAKQPWIITMGHRPMYCTNDDKDDCTRERDLVRVGYGGLYGLEKLFFENGVDLELWAHEHSYERLWPVYDFKVYNGSVDEPYTNPGAPVHIVTGSAGCQENHDHFGPIKPFSAFRNSDYGFTRMQVFNSSHLHLEQVSVEQNGDVIDSIWLIKDKHHYNPQSDDSNNKETFDEQDYYYDN